MSDALQIADTPPTPETRVCCDCGRERPLTSFESRGKGKRLRFCYTCHNRRKRASTKERMDALKVLAMRQVTQAYANHGPSQIPFTADLCAQLMRKFNGVEGFADFWFTQLSEAIERGRGSKTVMDALAQVVKIITQNTRQQIDAIRAVDDLSEEDFNRELAALTAKASVNILDLAEQDGTWLVDDESSDVLEPEGSQDASGHVA